MKKTLVCIFLVLASIVTLMPSEKASAHYNPTTGLPCDNTYYILNDFMAPISNRYETHLVQGGTCYKNFFVYNHKKYCSQCNYYEGFGPSFECTENHSICDIHKKDCSEIFH
ncbi:MAG: hypothetical protein IKW90_03350 [Lachnospiraceae bacterium]|nr:hypothetical protein [Lachnospiraceae bacterium]MBR6402541.1 hypothetical protein [Eubacterium sp.]